MSEELKPGCPKCGKPCTTALAYFCKCGWEQIGNNHEAWVKELDSLRSENEQLKEELRLENEAFYREGKIANDYEAKNLRLESLCDELAEAMKCAINEHGDVYAGKLALKKYHALRGDNTHFKGGEGREEK